MTLDITAMRRTAKAMLAGQFPLNWNSRSHGTNALALLDALDAARAEISAKDAEIAGIVGVIEAKRDEWAEDEKRWSRGVYGWQRKAADAILAAIKGGKHA